MDEIDKHKKKNNCSILQQKEMKKRSITWKDRTFFIDL